MSVHDTYKRFVFIFALIGGFGILFYGYYLFSHPRVVVEWQTATEIDTIGFNLYRAEKPDGPFEKLNTAIIPATNDPLKGGSYRYVDATIVPAQIYYYQLEDVDVQGMATKHEPIMVQAKSQGLIEMISGVVIIGFGLVTWMQKRTRIMQDAHLAEKNHGQARN